MERVTFSESELKPVGQMFGMGGPIPKYTTPITPRENYLRMLDGKTPLWIPAYTDTQAFVPRINPDNVARAFVLEANMLAEEEKGGKDMFGIQWDYVEVVGGSMVRPGKPLLEDANDWKEVVQFPDIESWDWESSFEQNKDFFDRSLLQVVWLMNGLFERLISFMDFEAAAVALIDGEQKDAVKELFSALCDLYEKILLKYKKYYNPDKVYFHDDWGSQRAPFFSKETCDEMLVPYVKRLVDFCHANGMYLELHCCGKNEMLVPSMIDCGIDEWGCQGINDYQLVQREHGDKIKMAVEMPLSPEDSPEEVEKKVKEFMDTYGRDFMKHPFYILDLVTNEPQREAYYVASRKLLNP